MPGETRKIIRLQPFVVSHFHCVGPAFGQRGQELVEARHEVAAMLVVAGIKSGKLEHQRANVLAEWFAGLEEGVFE